MKQDRFLIGILAGIGVLVVIALALFFARQDIRQYKTDDAPDSVVFNYVLAVTNRDYKKAYGYLADLDHRPTYDEFRQSFLSGMVSPDNVGVDVAQAEIDDDVASVEINLIYSSSDPFSSSYRNLERAALVRQDGEWRISSMPYQFWDYNWYKEPFKP
jgi:hypothetical protein